MSIALLLRYFWGAALGIAPLVLVTACAYDFYDISKSKCIEPLSDRCLSVAFIVLRQIDQSNMIAPIPPPPPPPN